MAYLQNIGTGSGGIGTSFLQLTLTAQYQSQVPLTVGTLSDWLLTNLNATPTVQPVNLTTGNNTINATLCPALATAGGVLIVPPQGNGTNITFKGAAGDTGVVLSAIAPSMLTFAVTPPTSFVLNVSSGITAVELIFF